MREKIEFLEKLLPEVRQLVLSKTKHKVNV